MRDPEAPTSFEAAAAYTLAGLATLLWVGCALPAGALADLSLPGDAAAPIQREGILLVPALLLLVIGPVATTLTRGVPALRAVLAATDAFVCLYAGFAVPAEGHARGVTAWILVGLMFALAALAVLDAVAILRVPRAGRRGSAGLRLALSLLVLLTPAWLLVQSHRELASLLVPFGFVALSAATESAARTERSLRRTAALLQFLIAAHLFVTLRYTIFENEPAVRDMGAFGTATLAIAVLAALLALLRCLALRSSRPPAPAPERAAAAPS